MKRLFTTVLSAASSRVVPPLVIGFFFLLYIGIAFFTDETLIALMAFTRTNILLAAILALIPLNSALSILQETVRHLKIRRMLAGKATEILPELFDETVELSASSSFAELESRLASVGYKTYHSENSFAAWRGGSNFSARILFLLGTFCLFTGILVSITTRTVERRMVIEAEPLPTTSGRGGTVNRITLASSSGAILSRKLSIEVAPSDSGTGKKVFGLYPPSLYAGAFVYPRYLGVALHLRFFAPDMPLGYETHSTLNCYPPGKEDSVIIPDSPYRIIFSIPEPVAGSDRYISYMTGDIPLQFKVLKGQEVLFTGSAPGGGEFAHAGYRVALPDIRRLVVTDFIGDYGVIFVWLAALFFVAAGSIWLPLRIFFPRKEILFTSAHNATSAYSRAEGGRRSHAGVFHEALDLVDARKLT